MQKTRNGPGRSRKLWPKNAHANILDISLFKSLSAQPHVTRDVMMEQHWNMDNFHEEWQNKILEKYQF